MKKQPCYRETPLQRPPAGDSWAHAATSRVILLWRGQQRFAYLYKSPYMPAAEAEFLITSGGVRGLRPSAPDRDR